MKRFHAIQLIAAVGLFLGAGPARTVRGAGSPQPLTRLSYRIDGAQLKVSPPLLSVPKGIPGSIQVQLAGPDPTQPAAIALTKGAHVEAILHGPSFDARRIVAQANQPLSLPPLSLVGDYQLDNIRLVDSLTGAVRMEGTPSSVPVHVFDEVLISRVTSRPLTYDEIQEKGIAIDQGNFRAVEFEVGFVLDGKTIPIKLPVVAPTFGGSGEIIPKAELDARLAKAAALNQQIASTVELPAELQTARLNIDIQGINFQKAEVSDQDLGLSIPPIPALMVIPGNIGYLHQFFSVQIYTENGSPAGSGLSVLNVQAKLSLPPGPDLLPGTYDSPGDDPLRFARLGPDKLPQSSVPVVRPGPDGKTGTADDIARLYAGESGQGEFLVEGLQEGLHVLDLDLSADLDGLATGVVKINGKASGSVLVRNPTFSLAFSHPRTTRAGEPYDAFVTILNTSSSPANQVSVTLAQSSLSGGVLQSPETVQLGNIAPGQTATAKYRVLAQRTGAVSFSNLTTGDDAVTGRFRLHMGVDERGVPLSPDTIGMPDYVDALPGNLVLAMNRVLGQALSVATAAQLPSGVIPAARSIITRRVLEMAEAGQRLRYGDSLNRVLTDLLLDWQGGRASSPGFDQILRVTDAGREFREAIAAAQQKGDTLDATARLVERGPDIAGLSEAWTFASVSDSGMDLIYSTDSGSAGLDQSTLAGSLGYRGARGHWTVVASPTGASGTFHWTVTNTVHQANLAVLVVGTNGSATRFQWSLQEPPLNACYHFSPGTPSLGLSVDTNCDGAIDLSLAATVTPVAERPPELLGVVQDPTVLAGRPDPSCLNIGPKNYATVLAVLYSKPMNQQDVNVPSAYALDNGNTAGSVRIQPGGRVALLNMRQPVGGILPRMMTANGVADSRGEPLLTGTLPIQNPITDGIAVKGRVVRADGNSAAGIPVTLTIYDTKDDPITGCESFTVHVSQVTSDSEGYFTFDCVLANAPYSISATDTLGLPMEVVSAIMEASSGDAVARQKLYDLVSGSAVEKAFVAAFQASSLAGAVAAAEGIDRAVLRDLVPEGSTRIGSVVPVALRFRGRGSVVGQVFAADGITPLRDVAVNLYPDPGSREQARGVLSDLNGRFNFNGVPLGPFTIQAQSSSGLSRTVAGDLAEVGGTADVQVVLSSAVIPLTGLDGQVLEQDGGTPHSGAQVFVGTFENGKLVNVVASSTSDSTGLWSISSLPAGTYDLVAFSFDSKRKGERRRVAASAGATNHITLSLEGTSRVIGRVETSTGAPVANALVAGGEAIVHTDANGLFTLTGVPLGDRSISAGLATDPAAGISFPRFGSVQLNVLPGVDNYAVVQLAPAGRIIGRVLDANGKPVPNARVAMPQDDGFQWVNADASGNYAFNAIALGQHTVSAPSPEAANNDISALLHTIANGSEDELQAAIGQAYAIFTGVSDPYLNGAGEIFNPGVWGFSQPVVSFDGQTVVADIHYLGKGTISGVVKNGQGVPIGARVRLTGIGPLANGMPSTIIRGEMNSDPAVGTFAFEGQALTGSWGLQAASPFYPTVITTNGLTTLIDPDVTNIVLRFPPVQDVNGRLAGIVRYPGGEAVGKDVNVKISFGNDYVIRTDTNGFFDTQIGLPAKGYSVEAEDPVTGLKGLAGVNLVAGITNRVDVRLLGRGALAVTVLNANGTPAAGAPVRLEQGSYPGDHYDGVSGPDGVAEFQNLFEGRYAVCAQKASGPSTIYGRSSAEVGWSRTNTVIVVLGPTANLVGTFLQKDQATPVGFAQVSVGDLGFTTTDADGVFSVLGIPLGTYRLVGSDSVNGRAGVLNVTLSTQGETRRVQLVEQALGEVYGAVIDSYRTGRVPGAVVTLSVLDGITAARTVTTGPDGSFSFPGTPSGDFTLSATDPVSGVTGQQYGSLPATASRLQSNVAIQGLATLRGIVYQADGVLPAHSASVQLAIGSKSFNGDTDSAGRVAFIGLPLGNVELTALSLDPAQKWNIAVTNFTLGQVGPAPDFAIRLPGLGTVSGRVLDSSGTAGIAGAEVQLNATIAGRNASLVTLADGAGRYSLSGVALGSYRLSATSQALGASYNGILHTNGQTDAVDLILGSSGTVKGHLVRADGTTPVPNIDVLLNFNSQSGLPGRAVARTDAQGGFSVSSIPLGAFSVEALAPDFNGVARPKGTLAQNGQSLDLGSILLDEAAPAVEGVTPPNSSVGVSTTAPVEIRFSEELDEASVASGGIFLRSASGPVPAIIQLIRDSGTGMRQIVRLTPSPRLQSQVNYDVVVISGTLLNPLGAGIATGPQDLVGRFTPAPFISHFTTADQAPPLLVSLYPANQDVQIDPRVVIRLNFNEPIRDSNFVFTLTGPHGTVPGIASVGLNGLVLVFTPTAALEVNATYAITVDGVRDLAGNGALGQPYQKSFATLDTQGPEIAQLRIANGAPPIAGSTVTIEATLLVNEAGASVRFTSDFAPLGVSTNGPAYHVLTTLPAGGQSVLRAIATDRFGNDGPLKELIITAVSNQAPAVRLVRLVPAQGPIPSGQPFTLEASATDDLSVTNLTVIGLGSLSVSTNFPGGQTNVIRFILPETAVAGEPLQFRALATDGLGVQSAEAILNLTISDATRPSIAILGPANDAVVDPSQDLTISVAGSDNSASFQWQLILQGSLVSTQTLQVSTTPNVQATRSFIVPMSAAPKTGGGFTATVITTDAATNTASVTRNFLLPDRQPPALASLLPSNGALKVSVLTTVDVVFSEPLSPASISATSFILRDAQGHQIPGTYSFSDGNRSVRFTPGTRLGFASLHTLTLTPDITDVAGNAFAGKVSSFTTVSDTPPALAFALLSPTGGSVGSGGSVSFSVGATSDLGITSLSVAASGAIAITNTFGDGSPREVNFAVPASARPGTTVQFLATAVDAFGGRSVQGPITLTVTDASAPLLAILSPDASQLLSPIQTLRVLLASSDNAGAHTLGVELGGALSTTQTLAVTASPSATVTNLFSFSLASLKPDGRDITITARGSDAAGNSVASSRTLRLIDTTGPTLVAASVPDGTGQQSLWMDGVNFSFSEPIATSTVNPGTIVSVNSAGVATPLSIDQPSSTTARLRFTGRPLEPGTTYTNRLLPGLTDLFGNALTAADGSPLPATGLPTRFHTAGLTVASPVSGAKVSPSSTVKAVVHFETGLGADFIRFVLADGAPLDAGVPAGVTNISMDLPLPAGVTQGSLTLAVSAVKVGRTPYALAPITLNVVDPGLSTNVVTIAGIQTVTMTQGQSTNLALQFSSPGSPLVLIAYPETNLPPTFVSLSAIQISNTPGGGSASATLNLNPLHDAVGDHDILVRGVARDGTSGLFHLSLTVLPDPSLQVTRWKDPVDGAWSDPARWTAGVPTADTVAVVDPPGHYTVSADTQPALRGLVLAETNATLAINADITLNAPVELRSGTLLVGRNRSLAIQNAFVQQGTLQLFSRDVNTYLSGSGWIENRGILEIVPIGSGGGWAHVYLPVATTAQGRFTVNTSAQAYLRSGSSLTMNGALEVQSGAELVLLNESSARTITVMAGAQLVGGGVLLIDGANQVLMAGDSAIELQLQLASGASVTGTGILTVEMNQTLTGSYSAPVRVGAGISVWSSDASFASTLTIENGGLLGIFNNRSLIISSILTNLGTLRMFSRDVNTYISGDGRVENLGLFEVAAAGTGGGWAHVYVPVEVRSGGRWQVDPGAQVYLRSGSSLTLAGPLDIEPGGTMVSLNESTARDITLLPGATLAGGGLLQVNGNNRLVMETDADLNIYLQLNDSAEVVGDATLRLTIDQTLRGSYRTPLILAAGASFLAHELRAGNTLTVEPTAILSVDYNTSLTLSTVLTNRGTLRMFSRDVNTYISGAGRVENLGLFEVAAAGAGGGWAHVYVPVEVRSGGRWQVDPGAQVYLRSGSSLTLAGLLDIEPGGTLASLDESTARDITLLPGATLAGGGVLQVNGNNRLVIAGALETGISIQLSDNARVAGTGSLTLRGDQSLRGSYESPVTLSDGKTSTSGARFYAPVLLRSTAVMTAGDTTFNSALTIEEGAVLKTDFNRTLTFNGVVTNLGSLLMFSRDVNTYLGGAGRVENLGLFEVAAAGAGGGWAHVYVPVEVRSGGRWQVDPGAQVYLRSGSSLTLAGLLDIEPGGTLASLDESTARDITLLPGATLAGGGVLQVNGNNRLVIAGALETGISIQLSDNARVAGTGSLTLRGDQSLRGSYEPPVTLSDGKTSTSGARFYAPVLLRSTAVMTAGDTTFNSALTIEEGTVLKTDFNRTLTFNGVVTNLGSLLMFSRDVNTYLGGAGRVENLGLFEVAAAGNGGGWAHVYVPVEVRSGGRWQVDPGAQVYLRSGSSLTLAGLLDIEPGGTLASLDESTARDITLLPGATLAGGGVLQVNGNNRLVIAGALETGISIQLSDNARVAGTGSLTLRGDQSLRGSYEPPVTLSDGKTSTSGARFYAPVLLRSTAVMTAGDTTFNSALTIEEGAVLKTDFNRTLTFNGVVTNLGTLLMFSRDVNTYISGAGRVKNLGLLEVAAAGNGGGWAHVFVPVEVGSGARWQVDAGAQVYLRSGSSLSLDGSLELMAGSSLWLDGGGAPRSVILGEGSSISGPGSLTFYGSNVLDVEGTSVWTDCSVALRESSSMTGAGLLQIGAGASLLIDHTLQVPGSVEVSGTLQIVNTGTTVTIGNTLQLEASGTLNNPGSIRAGVYADGGGTLIGNSPIVIGPPPPVITSIAVTPLPVPSGDPVLADTSSGRGSVVLGWSGPLARRFAVDWSADLRSWTSASAEVQESAPGRYQAVLTGSLPGHRAFYRLRSVGN